MEHRDPSWVPSADEVPRCEVCDWPLAADMRGGCVPGNCSFRPPHGSEDYRRIQARRAELARRDGKPENMPQPLPVEEP